MARKIFFSFHYSRDVQRVSTVRNSNVIGNFEKTPFYDKAEWEKIKRQGDQAVKSWIDSQLNGTSVTVVLIGTETYKRRWVKYEIEKSIEMKKGLIGVHINGIKDWNGNIEDLGPNPLPSGYPVYKWNADDGAKKLADWVENAAIKAGR
jgi:hypothetical protein